MLEMKALCEKCGEKLPHTAITYICSYECTFCKNCSEKMQFICPNCSGSLLLRPVRKS
ncbi:MAG: DUF1272 domain-containing protein [Pseudomonadales bacterium]|nr:DUF1272 domain-containing protein [Pseudomonadales bacterium]